MSRSTSPTSWSENAEPRYPYIAVRGDEVWLLRINEFPEAASLYSLFVDGELVEELMEWPVAWQRPPHEDAHEAAEYDRELRYAQRVQGIPPSKLVK